MLRFERGQERRLAQSALEEPGLFALGGGNNKGLSLVNGKSRESAGRPLYDCVSSVQADNLPDESFRVRRYHLFIAPA